MEEIVITLKDLEKYKDFNVHTVYIKRPEDSEVILIRNLSKAEKIAKEIEERCNCKVIVAEVYKTIRSSWKVKWKESRSGSRRPSSIKKVVTVDDSVAMVVIMTPKDVEIPEDIKEKLEGGGSNE